MQHELETPMWMVDAKTHRISMANQSAHILFGYLGDDLNSRTIFDLIVPEEADDLRKAFASRSFAGHGGNWTLRLPNGHRFRIHIRYHYVERDGKKLQFTFADEIYDHPKFPDGRTRGIHTEKAG